MDLRVLIMMKRKKKPEFPYKVKANFRKRSSFYGQIPSTPDMDVDLTMNDSYSFTTPRLNF
ncbi:MAG: hypothetical protein AAGB06_02605 [Verrucomicrobiota bacterium]